MHRNLWSTKKTNVIWRLRETVVNKAQDQQQAKTGTTIITLHNMRLLSVKMHLSMIVATNMKNVKSLLVEAAYR